MRQLSPRHALWLSAALILSVPAAAQSGGAPPKAPPAAAKPSAATNKAAPAAPAPAQPVRLSANYFMMQALQISEAAGNGLLDGVYASASPIMKAAQGHDAFVAQLKDVLARSGTATARDWVSVRREVVPAGQPQAPGAPPPGDYVVVVIGAETGAGRGRLETLTFHRDSDNQWRLCGFVAAALGQPAPSTNPQK